MSKYDWIVNLFVALLASQQWHAVDFEWLVPLQCTWRLVRIGKPPRHDVHDGD
jgi:hypothetical protein